MTDARIGKDLLGFVRGERGIADLRSLGVKVETSPRYEATFPSGLPAVAASLQDVATGFAAVSGVETRRTWAFVVLASDVDLPDPDDSPEAQTLMDALWQVSSGETPSEQAAATIEGLRD